MFLTFLIKNVVNTCPSLVLRFLLLTNWSDISPEVSWIPFLIKISFFFQLYRGDLVDSSNRISAVRGWTFDMTLLGLNKIVMWLTDDFVLLCC